MKTSYTIKAHFDDGVFVSGSVELLSDDPEKCGFILAETEEELIIAICSINDLHNINQLIPDDLVDPEEDDSTAISYKVRTLK